MFSQTWASLRVKKVLHQTAEPIPAVLKPLSLNKVKRHMAGGQRWQSNLLCVHLVQTAGKSVSLPQKLKVAPNQIRTVTLTWWGKPGPQHRAPGQIPALRPQSWLQAQSLCEEGKRISQLENPFDLGSNIQNTNSSSLDYNIKYSARRMLEDNFYAMLNCEYINTYWLHLHETATTLIIYFHALFFLYQT